MDAKEEQSHHGDEVKAGKKKGEKDRITNRLYMWPLHKTPIQNIYI